MTILKMRRRAAGQRRAPRMFTMFTVTMGLAGGAANFIKLAHMGLA